MDKCINSVNATLVIPSHPTADYQLKCVTYKTAVTQHMAMPRYEVYLCNACMIVAEAEGEKYIDNQACCRCPAARHRDVSTVHCVMVKKNRVKERTEAACNKCVVDLGIGPQLLGTIKEWMIIGCYSCNMCTTKTFAVECCTQNIQTDCSGPFAVECCTKNIQIDCSGHCLAHARLRYHTLT